nr:MAG TPA: hypothetical protein [Caudoviricetes sp.]
MGKLHKNSRGLTECQSSVFVWAFWAASRQATHSRSCWAMRASWSGVRERRNWINPSITGSWRAASSPKAAAISSRGSAPYILSPPFLIQSRETPNSAAMLR